MVGASSAAFCSPKVIHIVALLENSAGCSQMASKVHPFEGSTRNIPVAKLLLMRGPLRIVKFEG
eukprot:4897232-Amphidinium_carterae.1